MPMWHVYTRLSVVADQRGFFYLSETLQESEPVPDRPIFIANFPPFASVSLH